MIGFKHKRFRLEVLRNARTASDLIRLFSHLPHIMGVEHRSQGSLAGTSLPKFNLRSKGEYFTSLVPIPFRQRKQHQQHRI